ncbi:MAG TPA: hypothetical protein VN663_23050 [Ramlibacter sp.]|nr:hypothetical protein [Ramlibacter sp.]
MSAPRRLPLKAAFMRADVCEYGCPVVIMCDQDGNTIAEAHLMPEHVEAFVAQVRDAAEVGAAKRRPVA